MPGEGGMGVFKRGVSINFDCSKGGGRLKESGGLNREIMVCLPLPVFSLLGEKLTAAALLRAMWTRAREFSILVLCFSCLPR